jgi:hypothetical protein
VTWQALGGEPVPHLYTAHIEPDGARSNGPELPRRPPREDALRVLCVGGSTTFGLGVEDGDTLPAWLARDLAARLSAAGGAGPRAVQVWNHGVLAYTAGQAARTARARLDALRPHVVVVQLRNWGRRPFLEGQWRYQSFAHLVTLDPALLRENFPPLHPALGPVHDALLPTSAAYRALVGVARAGDVALAAPWGDVLGGREVEALNAAADARGAVVLYVSLPADRGWAPDGFPAASIRGRWLDLHRVPPAPEEAPTWELVHPPGAQLAAFARRIGAEIEARGWLAPGPHAATAPEVPGRPAAPREELRAPAAGPPRRVLGPGSEAAMSVVLERLSDLAAERDARIEGDRVVVRLSGTAADPAATYEARLGDPAAGCAGRRAGPWCLASGDLPSDLDAALLEALRVSSDPWSASAPAPATARPQPILAAEWSLPWSALLAAALALALLVVGGAPALVLAWALSAARRRRRVRPAPAHPAPER